jgi:integrase/recombinase XerD
MADLHWERYPRIAQSPRARLWLTLQADLGLAQNTVDAYGRAVQDYLSFCHRCGIEAERAARQQIAAYVRDLTTRSNPRRLHSGAGLANATLQQRLTAVRLFYDYLVEEAIRPDNPVARGAYTPGKGFAGQRDRALIPRYRRQPWIPSDEEWQTLLAAAREEPVRNRLMLLLSYDAALRREELCALATGDFDPAQRLVRVRAETTKNRQGRTIPYSHATDGLHVAYLRNRRTLSRERGPLFLSESRRNRAQPVTIWAWSKVVARLAARARLPQFTTHTLRHLCLTDLARAGWDIHEIALFAGHRSTQTTLMYIHLSGRDLAAKLARGMAQIHARRLAAAQEVLG